MKERLGKPSPAKVDGNFAADKVIQESPLQTCKEFCNCSAVCAEENDNPMGKKSVLG